jgi:hypothetical protein
MGVVGAVPDGIYIDEAPVVATLVRIVTGKISCLASPDPVK